LNRLELGLLPRELGRSASILEAKVLPRRTHAL